MSTRANIILKETYTYKAGNHKEVTRRSELLFYKHSDGDPEAVMPELNLFLKWIKAKKIRNDLEQSAGWLILIGAMEYNTIPAFELDENNYCKLESVEAPKNWKVGAFEPATELHGDIEFLYTIDLNDKSIKVEEVNYNFVTGKPIFTPKNYDNTRL